MRSAFGMLFQSRKFWIMFWDVIVSLVLYFGAKYFGAVVFEDIKFVIVTLQAPVLMLIYTIAKEDVALTEAAIFLPDEAKTTE